MLTKINTILSLSYIDREGNKYAPNDILMKYVEENNENLFVSFTEINKLGIFPKSKHSSTPLAIYAYPIKFSYDYYIKNKNDKFIDKLPFANNNNYFHIFKAKNYNKLLIIGKNEIDLEYYIKKINEYFKKELNNKNFNYNKKHIKEIIDLSNSTSQALYSIIVRIINENRTNTKSYIRLNNIFRYLGFDGIIDIGTGTIHQNEPCQALFFSKNVIETIETYNNNQSNKNKKYINIEIKNETLDGTKNNYDIKNCTFYSSNLIKVKINNIIKSDYGYYDRCDVNGGNELNNGVFESSKLSNIKQLKNSKLYSSQIINSNINNCFTSNEKASNFTGCNINKTNLNNSKLNNCNINNSKIYSGNTNNSSYDNCFIYGLDIENNNIFLNSSFDIDNEDFLNMFNENKYINCNFELWFDSNNEIINIIKSNKNIKDCIFIFEDKEINVK